MIKYFLQIILNCILSSPTIYIMIKTDNILIKEEDSLYFGSSPDPFTSPAYIPGKRDIGVLKFDENEE